jgi:hypothetical protein
MGFIIYALVVAVLLLAVALGKGIAIFFGKALRPRIKVAIACLFFSLHLPIFHIGGGGFRRTVRVWNNDKLDMTNALVAFAAFAVYVLVSSIIVVLFGENGYEMLISGKELR